MIDKESIKSLKSLNEFKFCMIKEFEKDDNLEEPESLVKNINYEVFYKIFRKGLESKYVTSIELQSPYLINLFVNKDEK